MFTRILVPTDFSASSDAALEYAKSLAQRFGASLHLLHVVEDPVIMGAYGADALLTDTSALRDALVADAETRLSHCLPAASGNRLRATTAVMIGPTASAIVDHAKECQADLIVMGTHGRSGIAHLVLGSVAERVVRTAACPVLTVREVMVKTEHAVPAGEYSAVPAV